MLAEDQDTIYVAFMGTKQRRDLVTNAAILQVLLWPDLEGKTVSLCLWAVQQLQSAGIKPTCYGWHTSSPRNPTFQVALLMYRLYLYFSFPDVRDGLAFLDWMAYLCLQE